jgi:hypothetical protein
MLPCATARSASSTGYCTVNVNAFGVGSSHHIPPGVKAVRLETWQTYAVKAVFWTIGAFGVQASAISFLIRHVHNLGRAPVFG